MMLRRRGAFPPALPPRPPPCRYELESYEKLVGEIEGQSSLPQVRQRLLAAAPAGWLARWLAAVPMLASWVGEGVVKLEQLPRSLTLHTLGRTLEHSSANGG